MRRLQQRLGYEFKDPSLLVQALTHRSASSDNNERLEFLGDAILGFSVAEKLFEHFGDADEGRLSRMRAHLVKRDTLASIGSELKLNQHLLLGPGEMRSGGQSRSSTLADAVEAIIAAVYLDSGIEAARSLIARLLGDRLTNSESVLQVKDPKTRLQEFLQSRQLSLPVYEVIEVSGEQHDQMFAVRCCIDAERCSEGTGASRRKAEQAAAAAMLSKLGQVG